MLNKLKDFATKVNDPFNLSFPDDIRDRIDRKAEEIDIELEHIEKWDKRFLGLAEHVAQWSKDPSTQTGGVIVDQKNRVVSMGYNGLPQALSDSTERLNNRELKYKLIVHGEMNALLFANTDVEGCTLYTWPFAPCSTCAKHFIQAGIGRIVAPKTPEYLRERWQEDLDLTSQMLEEAGITFICKEFNNGEEKE